MKKNAAFVAMKFEGDAWKDKRYSIIEEVLTEAGYDPKRSDQIKSSGPVVDEVCRYMERAALVVVDSTGDSHSVSYEIGYCHGVKRSQDRMILLRQEGQEIPFNYRHFRHHFYKDVRHLRRILRERLSLMHPLANGQYGYTFTFEVSPGAGIFGKPAAKCFLESLKKMRFSGRAEFFDADDMHLGIDHFYRIGLGLKFFGKELTPNYEWWMKFRDDLVGRIHKLACGLKHADTMSEMNHLGALRQTMVPCATAQFKNGIPKLILGGTSSPEESWLLIALNASISKSQASATSP